MSHWISLVTRQGRINAWESAPEDKPNGGVVLIHDVFGINDHLVRIAGHYAEAGYLTVIPALFDRMQRDVELDYTPENQRIGRALSDRLGVEAAIDLVASAVDAIAHAGRLAIVGHGWGGTVASRAAEHLGLPFINYYGRPGTDDPQRVRPASAGILHYGLTDPAFAGQQPASHEGNTLVRFGYPAGAHFDRPAGDPHHHAESAALALHRSLGFLRDRIFQDHD